MINILNTFLFILMLFGFLSGIRIFLKIRSQAGAPTALVAKIGSICVSTFFFVVIMSKNSVWPVLLTLLALLCLLVASLMLFQRWHETLLQSAFEAFLAELSVGMKRGDALRTVMAKIIHQQPPLLRARLVPLWNIVYFSQHPRSLHLTHYDRKVLQILRSLDSHSYGVVKRCDFFRQQIQVERQFRQKSGELLWQPRYQAGVLTILYIFLALTVPILFSPANYLPYLLGSSVLFMIGIILIFNLGGRFKWIW